MTAIGLGQSIGCSNPLLQIFLQTNGILTDPDTLEFIIYDISTPTKRTTPVQVYPAVPPANVDDRQAIVIADCPAGGRRSAGVFAAAWDVPQSEAVGTHRIRWFYKMTPSSSEETFDQEFDVLALTAAAFPDDYALVSDLRDEGVSSSDATDARCQMLITLASRYIERITGRFFNPRLLTFDLNGNGTGQITLEIPIIAIQEVRITIEGISFSGQPIDLTDVAVYNRHLTGLMKPDDRDAPKIQFKRADPEFARLHALLGRRIFYDGKQNIRVKGLFGYTEPNGTQLGKTPDLVNMCCKLLAIRNLPKFGNVDDRQERLQSPNIASMRTRDQEVSYFNRNLYGTGATQGPFTGDTEIDSLLMMFSAPPVIRAV